MSNFPFQCKKREREKKKLVGNQRQQIIVFVIPSKNEFIINATCESMSAATGDNKQSLFARIEATKRLKHRFIVCIALAGIILERPACSFVQPATTHFN